jgi:hypothetical protein
VIIPEIDKKTAPGLDMKVSNFYVRRMEKMTELYKTLLKMSSGDVSRLEGGYGAGCSSDGN